MIRTIEDFRKKYFPKGFDDGKPLTGREIGRKLAKQSIEILKRELRKR